MKKIMTILASAFVFASVQAKNIYFIIDAKGIKSNLTAGKISPGQGVSKVGCRFEYAAFLRKQNQEKQMLYAYFPLKGDTWRTGEFSFTAEKDGIVNFSIYVLAGKAAICDNITVTGTELINGDFEKGASGWKMIDFKRNDGPPEILEDEGFKNSKAVRIFSASQTIRQTIKVKAGKEIKVTFLYKETEL